MSRGGFRPPRNLSPSNEKNRPEKTLKPLQGKAPTASTKESAKERFLSAVGFRGLIFTTVYFTVIQNPKEGFSPNSTTVLAFRIRFEVNTTKSSLHRTYPRNSGSTHATSRQHRDSEVLSITGKGATSQIDTSERRKVTAFVSGWSYTIRKTIRITPKINGVIDFLSSSIALS
jgi:hypothetical protein